MGTAAHRHNTACVQSRRTSGLLLTVCGYGHPIPPGGMLGLRTRFAYQYPTGVTLWRLPSITKIRQR